MYASLKRLGGLPPETLVYCAHEYTLANARFAVHAEPDNAATSAAWPRSAAAPGGEMTVPTTLAAELATNPFLRPRTEFAAEERQRQLPFERASSYPCGRRDISGWRIMRTISVVAAGVVGSCTAVPPAPAQRRCAEALDAGRLPGRFRSRPINCLAVQCQRYADHRRQHHPLQAGIAGLCPIPSRADARPSGRVTIRW